jgi:tetratricopeptide (TPR) repeat protein
MKKRLSFIAACRWHWFAPLVLLLCCWGAGANTLSNITAGEKALLPEYCVDTQTFGYGDASYNTSPRAPYWIGLMGKTFWAMHHHCWALIREHRSRGAGVTRQERDGHLIAANSDYVYVIDNATPDFVLLPEIYTRIGENYVLLGNIGAAMDAFGAARKSKADYWPPYVAWARVMLKAGKRQEALAHVETVMRLAPDDAELRRQYNLIKNGPAGPTRAMSPASARTGSAVAGAGPRSPAAAPGGASTAVSSVAAQTGKPGAASAVSR